MMNKFHSLTPSLPLFYTLPPVVLGGFLAVALSGCSTDLSPKDKEEAPASREDSRKYMDGRFFGDDLLLFGNDKKYDPNKGGGMPVNQYLWRASLNVISFMPLASSDATGGVIITDWYTSRDKPNQRLKMTISILDRVLRADALKVTMNKQIRGARGEWIDAAADSAMEREMEDLILTKARELKIKNG